MKTILKNESVKQTYIHVADLEIYFPGILKDFKNYCDWFFMSASLFLGSMGTNFETDVEQKQFVLPMLKKFWIWFVQFYQKMWREKYGRCRKRTIRRVLICFEASQSFLNQ